MKKGDTVMIYVDPATRNQEEGEAVLIEQQPGGTWGVVDGFPMDYWKVRFKSDNWTGMRFILNTEEK